MQKLLMNGLVLFATFSCSQAVIKEPQPTYVISTKFMSVAKGYKTFNYKNGEKTMGEWIAAPQLVKFSDLPENIIAFPLEIWLKKIKPALKNLARRNRDQRD